MGCGKERVGHGMEGDNLGRGWDRPRDGRSKEETLHAPLYIGKPDAAEVWTSARARKGWDEK
jgi:hypothetical protein